MQIHTAAKLDQDGIHAVHLSAFPENERVVVAKLAVDLLTEDTKPTTLSLIARDESDKPGDIIGHAAFSPVTSVNEPSFTGFILAPLGVKPAFQGRGVGAALISTGIKQLKEQDVAMVFVYGDPAYYSRFGFTTAAAKIFVPPYPLQFPFGWQAMALTEADWPTSPIQLVCAGPLCDPGLW